MTEIAKPGVYVQRERDTKNPIFAMKMPDSLKGRDLTGLGSTVGDDLRGTLDPIIEGIRNRKNCTMLVMPNVEHAKFCLDGPQTDSNIKLAFGTRINPFGFGPNPPINGSYDTTLAQPDQTQTNMIICAIGWHLRPEPLCFTATGSAFPRPTVSTTKPGVPDVYTTNDQTNGAVASTLVPAVYEHGWWSNFVCWYMSAGYNLRWMMGQNTNIFNDELRNTAYMPPNAQDGSASSSEVDLDFFVYQLNQYYQSVAPGCNSFLKPDFVRYGSIGTGGANLGQFTPSRDLQRVGATYGGMGLRELLKGNSEYRPLTTPYAMGAGIPWGLFAEENNVDLATAMRQYLSITNGFGGAPPATFNDDPTIYAAGATTAGANLTQERLLDGSASVPQTVPSSISTFKGGRLLIEVKVKGFEISEDLHMLMKVNSRARDAICSECGIAWGPSRS